MKKLKLLSKIFRQLFILKKNILQQFKPYTEEKKILFIMGCQRSGTSLMLRVFENDFNTKTFSEFSTLSSQGAEKIRLNPLHLVQQDLQKVRVPFIILKPLVESQNAPKLLNYFNSSKALWMYRNYKDVASSNLNYFQIKNGIKDLRPIIENKTNHWISEKVSPKVKKIILSHFSENMNPYDAAVLFWYIRNSLYFELGLDQNPNVLLCQYEDLIARPVQIVKSIYSNLNQNYPGAKIHQEIHSQSLKKGQDISLSPQVDKLAKELLDKLNQTYQTKNA